MGQFNAEVVLSDEPDPSESLSLFKMILALSNALDLISPEVVNHHKLVSFIAKEIAEVMGLTESDQAQIVWAGLLHDIGAFSLKQRLKYLDFERKTFGDHAELGYRLVNRYSPFQQAAKIIRHHHTFWQDSSNRVSEDEIPTASHILHVADRAAILVGAEGPTRWKTNFIVEKINSGSGSMFCPEIVEAFNHVADRKSFWRVGSISEIQEVLEKSVRNESMPLSWDSLKDLGKLFCGIIDFKSAWTATHSTGVAEVTKQLALKAHFSTDKSNRLQIAGYVHDLGKLAVPNEILDNESRLTHEDFQIIKKHAYHTYILLRDINEFRDIRRWASYHHERLDGSGYPFSLSANELPMEARLVAVSDFFTAISEDRPYREGMSEEKRIRLMDKMAGKFLDGDIIRQLVQNFHEIDYARMVAQKSASIEYQDLYTPSPEVGQNGVFSAN